MTFTKILSFLVLSIFLFSGVSAVTTYASWGNDEEQSTTIENGNTASFTVDFFAMQTPIHVKVALYDSADNLINTFVEQDVSSNEFHATYTINRAMYGNAGDFSVIATGVDAHSSQSHEISLKVNPDATKPVITLNGVNPQFVTLSTPYVEAGVSAIDNLDGDITSKVITDSTNVNTGLTGTYTVFYAVSDNAGNTITAQRTIKVVASGTDITNPIVTIAAPINGATYTSADSLSFTATDANLNSCEYSLNGGTKVAVSCASGVLTTITPLTSVEGTNTWTVYAKDVAGNEGNASVTFTINPTAVDTTAPVITVLAPENREYSTNRLTFEITTDETATAEFSLDGGSRTAMTNHAGNDFTYIVSGINNGDHTIIFYAKDASNNEANRTINFSVHKSSSSGGIGIVDSQTTVSTPATPSTTSKPTATISAGNKKDSALNSAPLYLISAIAVLGIAITSLSLFRKLRK